MRNLKQIIHTSFEKEEGFYGPPDLSVIQYVNYRPSVINYLSEKNAYSTKKFHKLYNWNVLKNL